MTKKAHGAVPIHPGEILLEEFLKSYDPPVSQVQAAARMHIPNVRLNRLIRGKRAVTPDTALRLADLTGTSPEFWMNLQCRYDLWQAAEVRAHRKELPRCWRRAPSSRPAISQQRSQRRGRRIRAREDPRWPHRTHEGTRLYRLVEPGLT